ncbi:MAG: TspO/MBR family protein [bacterium]
MAKKSFSVRLGVFLFFLLLCFFAAWVGGRSTYPEITGWYAALKRPSFGPPNWMFGPVWTVLYLMMAMAAWGVWDKVGVRQARGALLCFFIQLVLNAIWPSLFFGMHRPDWALFEIFFLWLAIGLTFLFFFHLRPGAAYLLLPYWAWVSFAAVLNLGYYRLNPL